MKILILGSLTSPYTNSLRYHLGRKGLSVDVVDVFNNLRQLESESSSGKLVPVPTKLLKSRFVGTVIKILILKRLLKTAKTQYNLINVHFFHVFYSRYLARNFFRSEVPLIISVWGSDFLRRRSTQLDQQRALYDFCSLITTNSPIIREQLSQRYAGINDKIELVQFGLDNLDEIDKVSDDDIQSFRRKYGIMAGKIVVTCGYNGKKEQRHIGVIESLSNLNAEHRDKLHVILPLTSGLTDGYLAEVKDAVKNLGAAYTILEEYLTTSELAILRVITNILVHVQTTDSFSGSIVEALYSNTVLINGSWNQYPLLKQKNIDYLEVDDVHEVRAAVGDIIDSESLSDPRLERNKEIIHSMSSWENTTDDWIRLYKMVN